jgi:hypothetical protein|tara:strand:- start:7615 stop:8232 length:618 start_codon:yes stop_codon:yes gene_type:complete
MYNFFEMPLYESDEHLYNRYLVKHRNKQNKGAASRDSEKQRTYAAENLFMRMCDNPTFNTLDEVTKFSRKIYKSKTWIKLWEKSIESDVGRIFTAQPVIAQMNSRTKTMSGFTNGRTVTLCPITGFNKYVLLHELAHTLGHMHHGRSFRQCLLSLVGTFMGAHEKKVLANEFKRKGISYGDARKPQTFEVWMAAKQRMAKMRELK